MRICALLAALAALSVLMAGCQSSPRHERHHVEAAESHDTELARRLSAEAVELIEAGELTEAEATLEAALDADPDFGPAHNNLGRIYYQQRRFYKAAWEFEYASERMPEHPQPQNNLGLVMEQARRLDEAIAHYRAALKLAPQNTQVLGNLVRARIRRGDDDPQLARQLQELILNDRRPEWVQWARQQLETLEHRP